MSPLDDNLRGVYQSERKFLLQNQESFLGSSPVGKCFQPIDPRLYLQDKTSRTQPSDHRPQVC